MSENTHREGYVLSPNSDDYRCFGYNAKNAAGPQMQFCINSPNNAASQE